MSEQEKKAVKEPTGIATEAKPAPMQDTKGKNSHPSAERKEKTAKGNPQAPTEALGGVPL